ncbi:FAD-dependent oxidoreductase [Bremerella cremea]|uniref:FAD-dependent oxidoreductase n=1 Tax=Bremerella cremea TaxID=1031537 RepID=UPI00131417F1|nr:FAD-dependent oxidoreductase [Bremerella cremea]
MQSFITEHLSAKLSWMAVDTPARIVIVGAGPIGIEAALYARFLGYEVTIFDSQEVGSHLLQWGRVPMFTPFGMNSTPLGLSALAAQDEGYSAPAEDAILTGSEFVEQYLLPLAETDLVVDGLKLQHEVISIARKSHLKHDYASLDSRGNAPFETLVRDAEGREHLFESEIVLDCSGAQGEPNYLGGGGNPALGELEARAHFRFGVIDASGTDREQFANQQVLVIGSDDTAATNICELSQLARESLETHVTWLTQQELPSGQPDPLAIDQNDPYPSRRRVLEQANQLAGHEDGHIDHWPETQVQSVHYEPQNDHFHVTLSGKHEGVHTFDRVLVNVGYRPNLRMLRELQVATCCISEAPRNLAVKLAAKEDAAACQIDATTLFHPEPNFYILGAKSYGRRSDFVLATGFEQIRQVFAVIGDRENLNLYAKPMTKSE